MPKGPQGQKRPADAVALDAGAGVLFEADAVLFENDRRQRDHASNDIREVDL